MIKNIIKRVIVCLLLFLIFGFIKSCKVNAESTSDLIIKSSSFIGIGNTQYTNHFSRYYTTPSNFTIVDNVSLNYGPAIGSTSQTPDVWSRWSICALPNTSISTAVSPNVTDISIENTHISCTFSSNAYGFVTFIKFKLAPLGLPSGGVYNSFYQLNVQSGSVSIQTLAVEYSLNQFPIYDGNSAMVTTVDAILQAVLANNNNNSVANAINNQTTSIITNQNTNTSAVVNSTNANTQAINDMNDTIKDDDVEDPTDYSSNVANNGVITQLITLPITLFQKILNSTSASCTPFNLGSLYGYNLTMPCINLQNVLGNTLYNVIDILISGLFIYSISRKMVKVFNSLSSMKEGDVING